MAKRTGRKALLIVSILITRLLTRVAVRFNTSKGYPLYNFIHQIIRKLELFECISCHKYRPLYKHQMVEAISMTTGQKVCQTYPICRQCVVALGGY